MHVGIDLGTTYSLIARVDPHGNPVLFPDMHEAERFKTPSVVHVGSDGALVGQPVEELLEDTPNLPHVRFVKLRMGEEEPVLIDNLGQAWRPEGIAALILLKLQRDAKAFTDDETESAVLSVPAHFSDAQRRATLHSGQLAGLNVVDLVEEPLAAATYYGAKKAQPNSTILVYDLGGGTFDATVLRVEPEGLYALSTDGVSDLGGKTFDEAIMAFIAEQFRMGHRYDPLDDPLAALQLRRHAEAIKIKLSLPGKGQVRTSLMLGGRAQEIIITRQQLEKICQPHIDRTLAVCERSLKAAGLDWKGVDQVMLAGGSTLLPAVESAVRRVADKPGDRVTRHQPHMAIAYGAALLAGQRAGAPTGDAPALLQRITGFDLGFRTIDPRSRKTGVDKVITKNSPIPATGTRTYYSNRADQTRMVFELVQVRDAESKPESLGHFAFKLENPRKNLPLEVSIGYDERGLVSIVARDPDSGQEVKQAFEDASVEGLGKVLDQAELLRKMPLCE